MMLFGARKGGIQSQIRYQGKYKMRKPNEIRALTTVIMRYYCGTNLCLDNNNDNLSRNQGYFTLFDLLLMRKIYASPGGTANR